MSDGAIVRQYRGQQQKDALAEFQNDAANLARQGYVPTSQSWAQGQWGCGAWLVALLLCVLLIGFLVFIYMIIVKPEGTLTVTYTRYDQERMRPPAFAQGQTAPASSPPRITYKTCSRCLEPNPRSARTCSECGLAFPVIPSPTAEPAPQERTVRAEDEVTNLGEWEVVESASEYLRPGGIVSIKVDSRVVAVAGTVIVEGIPLAEAVAEAEGDHLCLARGSVRRFLLSSTDNQDIGRAVESIRERQDPSRRALPSAVAVATSASSPSTPPAAASSGANIEARLATLNELRDSGVVTDDEYAAKRAKILDEL